MLELMRCGVRAGLVAGVALLTLAVLVALVSLALGIIAELVERATKGGAE